MTERTPFTRRRAFDFYMNLVGTTEGIYSSGDNSWTLKTKLLEIVSSRIEKDVIKCDISIDEDHLLLFFKYKNNKYVKQTPSC